MKIKALYCIFLTIVIQTLFAQSDQIRFSHLTVDDGLSQSWVHCVCQDKYGFIWFGTDDGLNRYDGNQFIIYKNNLRDNTTISSNSIESLFEDSKGNLWVGTANGLNLYDRKMEQFIYFGSLSRTNVISISEDKNENLWVGTAEFLYKYHLISKKLTCYKGSQQYTDSLSNEYINVVFIDSKNNIWVGTQQGLNLYNQQTDGFIKYFHDSMDPYSLSNSWIYSILEDHQGRLWIGTRNGLNLFVNSKDRPDKGIFIRFVNDIGNQNSIAQGGILSLLEDGRKRLWIGIDNGGLDILNISDVDQGEVKFSHYRHDPQKDYSLNNNSVYTLFQDKQNIIWIGTFGNGINKVDRTESTFMHYKNEPQNDYSLSDNHVNALLDDGNYVWIGTEGGLNRFDKNKHIFKRYTHNQFDNNSIGSNAVWSLYKDSKGNLWVGTWGGGLNLFNSKNGTFKHFYNNPYDTTSIGSNNVFSIYEDNQHVLWIGTMGGGLNKFNYFNGTFTRFRIENSTINSNYVEAILPGPDNSLWLANVSSLDLFDKENSSFKHYIHRIGDTTSLNGNKVFSIYYDSKGTLWVGTDAGINRYNEKTDGFICYRMENGLPDNSIKSIIEDRNGNLWIGTNKGLSKFVNAVNPEKGMNFKNYTPKGGLQGYEFERRSCMLDLKGCLYFGGVNGLNVFYPDSIKDNTFIPNIVITEFLLFNQPVKVGAENSPLKENITLTKELVLNYKQSVFSFKFQALNFEYPSKNQYAYRLENFNDKWIYTGNQGEATFTNLDQGEYTFHVIGSNNDGIWNEVGTSITIKILPPWWETWWFRVLLGLAIAGLLVGFYFYWLGSLRRQKEQLRLKVIERTKEIEEKNIILQKQSNELSEINILLEERQEHIEEQAEELRTQAEDLQVANINLTSLNATKDKFFSIIAHDLKNPFTTILGFCEVLFTRYDKYDDSKRKHLIEIIYKSANNIYKLLENLLQWSRSQTGNIKFEPESFELSEVISGNLILMENQMKEKQLTSRIDVPQDLKVFADRNMINTVIRNLISNAIKFSESGEIVVQTKEHGKLVTVMVKDCGVGMPEETAKSLFIIGGAKSSEGTRGELGTGLGLILCKDFVEKNGGTIEAESEINKGSSFYFTIPVERS